jgi:hypothetical protein
VVTRRAFIGTLAGGLLGAPLAARAQQGKVARIGILGNVPRNEGGDLWEAFVQGLRALGYIEGRNITIEERSCEGHYERLPALASDLVRLRGHSHDSDRRDEPWRSREERARRQLRAPRRQHHRTIFRWPRTRGKANRLAQGDAPTRLPGGHSRESGQPAPFRLVGRSEGTDPIVAGHAFNRLRPERLMREGRRHATRPSPQRRSRELGALLRGLRFSPG